MKISVTTPSVREEGLEMVRKCLARQSFKDYEWLVCSPFEYKEAKWVPEPPKNEGDYYGLNKAMNALFKAATGELVVQITDWIWFPPDTLQKLWDYYQSNPKGCVSGVGNQYERVENSKPEGLVWVDPRTRTDFGSYYEIKPIDMELCLGSIPRQALLDVGGVDETYDQGAAVGEKEMLLRIDKAGYNFWLAQSLEYRALKHPRLSTEWDDKYKIASAMFVDHVNQINNGTRLKLNYL